MIKRLFWDVESSPNVGLFFKAGYDQTINPESIILERKTICIAYKWEDSPKVTVLRWDENQDDKEMLKKFILVANEADELVAHFGDRYDLPWFRTRCLYHKLPPLPAYKTVDTCAWAKKYYYFNSGKLDYISDFLGHGKKLKTDHSLWKKVLLDKDPKALDYMCRYCGVDVLKLEKVYHDLKYCVKPKTHAGVYDGKEKWTCPRTGSEQVKMKMKRVTANGTVQYQMQSLADGGYYTISESAHKAYLAAKSK
jgi:hypothetical protein